jgi:hypothetical protein
VSAISLCRRPECAFTQANSTHLCLAIAVSSANHSDLLATPAFFEFFQPFRFHFGIQSLIPFCTYCESVDSHIVIPGGKKFEPAITALSSITLFEAIE